jgi:hypothetical protein
MRDRRHESAYIITAALCAGFGGCAEHASPAATQKQAAPVSQSSAAIPAASRQPATSAPVAAKIGADFGPAGGWLVGVASDHLARGSAAQADEANRRAEQRPANPADVKAAATADLNHDGFVTLDEVLAMKRAGLTDSEMIQRLQATGQVFSATDRQQQYLRDRGIDQTVIDAMLAMKGAAPGATTATASRAR